MQFRNSLRAKCCFAAALLLSGAGLSCSKPSAAPAPAPASPSPTATPSPAPAVTTPAAAAAAAPDAPPHYDGIQQGRYIATAQSAFVAQRQEKLQAFLDTRTEFENAGGISTKGLTNNAAVTARRDLLAKVRTANDDYLAFVTTEEDTFRAELAKTPLVKADIDSVAAEFATKANIPRAIKLQQIEKDLLSCSDDILADLEKWDGQWSLTASNKLLFKKKSDEAAYAALEKKYNGFVKDYQSLQAPTAPSPGASPAASATPAAGAN